MIKPLLEEILNDIICCRKGDTHVKISLYLKGGNVASVNLSNVIFEENYLKLLNSGVCVAKNEDVMIRGINYIPYETILFVLRKFN